VKQIALIAVVLIAGASVRAQSPAPAPASSPATQPDRQEQTDGGGGGGGERDGRPGFRDAPGDRRFGDGTRWPGGRGEWRRGDARPEYFAPPTTDEWAKIEAFMKSHSPERLKRLEEIGDDERQQGVRSMFAARYRTMQDLKDRDPEIYQIRLARMPVEDQVFDLGWKVKHKQSTKADEDQLRAQLRVLIKSRLQERAVHVRRAEQRLQEDEKRLDELVTANLKDIADDGIPRDLRPQNPMPGRRERRGDDDNATDVNATQTGD
jgi:hypothetical protein